MAAYIGSKVSVKTTEGEYEGILHAVAEETGRFTLDKVVSVKSKKRMTGLMHFYQGELLGMFVLEEKCREKKVVATDGTVSGSRPLLKKKDTPSHLKKLAHINREEFYAPPAKQAVESEEETPRPDTAKGSMPILLPHIKEMKYTILYDTGIDFRNTIAKIQKYRSIGLAAEGSGLGRSGELLWIQIGLPDQCFLFDIKTIGANGAFASGLYDIMVDPNIQKVINNCRQLSDYLFHKHKCRLVNVFDTQVANVIVYKNDNNGDLPRYVESLSQLVVSSFNITELETIYKERARGTLEKDDQMNFWGSRPASEKCIQTAMFNVMYLLALYHKLQDALMNPLRDGVDIYLATLRDAREEQYIKRMENYHLVPNEFADLAHYGELSRFVENSHAIADPSVIFSHDAVWHQADPDFDQRMEREMEKQRRGRARATSNHQRPRSRSVDGRATPPSPKIMERAKHATKTATPSSPTIMERAKHATNTAKGTSNEPLITHVHPKNVKETVEQVLNQPFTEDSTKFVMKSTTSQEEAVEYASMPAGTRCNSDPVIKYTVAGAESHCGQFPEKDRAASSVVDGGKSRVLSSSRTVGGGGDGNNEEWGLIPDVGKLNGPLLGEVMDNNGSKGKDEGFITGSDDDNNNMLSQVSGRLPKCAMGGRKGSDGGKKTLRGHVSDSALMNAVGRGQTDDSVPRGVSVSPSMKPQMKKPVPTAVGRGKSLLLNTLSSPKPAGRGTMLNFYG